ncbi:MAG TPA: LON peptidase substrate-binding domain-containing protein, partial [Thermomicrobiales bacterium]|nr:LON peptidase substrate-binding domain-containing protein [Thermomicrobiales bacterium]
MPTRSSRRAESPDEAVRAIEAPAVAVAAATPKPRASRASKTRKEPKRRPILLPVLVVEETVLLPHMSIPFPIEDDEAAMVVDRAARMDPRYVLVLTERAVMPAADETPAALIDEHDPELRALLADAIAQPQAAEGGEQWAPDDALGGVAYELCPVGVIAEVGQRISRPGGHAHVILQGVARGVVEALVQQEPYLVARVARHDDPIQTGSDAEAAM